MADKIQILPMTAGMAPQIAALERVCFADPWSEDSFAGELQNPLAVYFAALMDDEVIGYIGMHHILDEGHITNAAVSPGRRRRGVARKLVEALIGYARENGLCLLTLEVRRSNEAAIALYGGLGFVPVGVRPGYYRRPAEDAILMTKEQ